MATTDNELKERIETRKHAQEGPHDTELNPNGFPGIKSTPSTVDPLVAGYATLFGGALLFLIVLFLVL